MERNREFRELVQKEKEKLENEEIFESAFYRQMLLSVAGEMTGGTLKRVELVKKPGGNMGRGVRHRRGSPEPEECAYCKLPDIAIKKRQSFRNPRA